MADDTQRRHHMRRIFTTYLCEGAGDAAPLVYATAQQRARLLQTMDRAEARLDR
jgi:hypothetical protein